MKDRLDYDYFYGGESEQFSFYRIPRQLIVGPEFKHASTDAKLLYGLMLDRMGLSARNGWYDEENRVFIYYPLDEIKEALNCGNDKAVKLLAELDTGKGIGLIQRVKQGQGKPAMIYVKRFTCKDIPPQVENPPTSPARNPDFGKTEVKSSENQKSRLRESRSAEFGKSECNYTYKNQTERNQTNLSIRPVTDGMDWQACREEVMENISFDQLVEEYGKEDVEGVTDLTADVLTSSWPTVQIGREEVLYQNIAKSLWRAKEKLKKMIEQCLRKSTKKIHNIRAYLLTSLYNAPTTIGQFYQAEVQHDLYGSG